MTQQAYSDELAALIAFARAFDSSVVVTSTTGGKHVPSSWHYRQGTDGPGLAGDFAFSGANKATRMLALAQHFDTVGSKLAELFHNPLKHSWIDGRRVTYLEPDHFDHVHVAVPKGTFLVPIPSAPAPPAPATPVSQQEDDGMADALVITYPNGSKLIAKPDGSVFTAGTGVFYGSMYDLKPEQKQGVTSIVAATPLDPSKTAAGYVLWSAAGGKYTFDAALWKSLGH